MVGRAGDTSAVSPAVATPLWIGLQRRDSEEDASPILPQFLLCEPLIERSRSISEKNRWNLEKKTPVATLDHNITFQHRQIKIQTVILFYCITYFYFILRVQTALIRQAIINTKFLPSLHEGLNSDAGHGITDSCPSLKLAQIA